MNEDLKKMIHFLKDKSDKELDKMWEKSTLFMQDSLKLYYNTGKKEYLERAKTYQNQQTLIDNEIMRRND